MFLGALGSLIHVGWRVSEWSGKLIALWGLKAFGVDRATWLRIRELDPLLHLCAVRFLWIDEGWAKHLGGVCWSFALKCIESWDYTVLQTVYRLSYSSGNLLEMHKCCCYFGVHLEETLSALLSVKAFTACVLNCVVYVEIRKCRVRLPPPSDSLMLAYAHDSNDGNAPILHMTT